MKKNKKYIVLSILFVVPLIFYIFLQIGTHNFGKLPIVTKDVIDVSNINKKYSFKDKISVVAFLGNDVDNANGEIFNLNEKIYKKFYGYRDFQIIVFAEESQKAQIDKLKNKLGLYTDLIKWNFIVASKAEIEAIYESFKTISSLDLKGHSSKAYLIDKEVALRRGKSTIKSLEKTKLFGYNMKSVAELKNDMIDDIKVVFAEYNLALKKNNSDERRKNSISNEKK
ncbi:hypothetical protein [Tenacibaculum sp. M341]|uniref:hypothetical protein n=1 Tax=Tenacibaculum sp. M341 TaxID=2530339 RepID=UPI001046190D|nr:hypothetical protein [Tenacibaculum sp. M341]TCI84941.1 hypothetical protein EYW44_18895 [Tenacibaculum sp. M341]